MEIVMNHKTILSLGFLLLCASVLVDSLRNANAYPQGPNVSMGSNPIDSAYAVCNGWTTLFTNSSSHPFIITDVIHSYPSSNGQLRIGSQTIYSSREGRSLKSGLVIAPGETVECTHSGWTMTISGYYTH
jgi:hypothetical protein